MNTILYLLYSQAKTFCSLFVFRKMNRISTKIWVIFVFLLCWLSLKRRFWSSLLQILRILARWMRLELGFHCLLRCKDWNNGLESLCIALECSIGYCLMKIIYGLWKNISLIFYHILWILNIIYNLQAVV